MYYYLNQFYFFAILGFVYENILHLITKGSFSNNPFVGPWMPIYGFGVILMIFLTRLIFNRLKAPRWLKQVWLFISVVVILTILEQIGGMLTEAVFHKSFWDYSDMMFNWGKYICLEVSLAWGVACFIFLYLVKPRTDKIIKKIPKWLTWVVSVLFIIDFIYSFFF